MRRTRSSLLAALVLLVASACSSQPSTDLPPKAAEGRTVANEAGCLVCHSTDGSSSTGPTFASLYQSNVTLTDGTTVTADQEYLRRSIIDPEANVVKGFAPLMPSDFSQRLSSDDIDALIAYIVELK